MDLSDFHVGMRFRFSRSLPWSPQVQGEEFTVVVRIDSQVWIVLDSGPWKGQEKVINRADHLTPIPFPVFTSTTEADRWLEGHS